MNCSKNSRVLVISPSLQLALPLEKQLACCGFNVIVADNPNTFLKVPENSYSYAIVVDIDLYENPEDFIRILFETFNISPYIPVIIVSSTNDINIKLKLFKMGIKDYVLKPFNSLELSTRINNHLSQYSAFLELIEKNRKLEEKAVTLEQMATIDAMTGLYNKRYVLDRLSSDISYCARYNEPISIIMADIDFFKGINDRFGHTTGDKILQKIGRLIKDSIRSVDIAARYGGEEFLIVCPKTDSAGAKILAERIRRKIHCNKFILNGRSIGLTLSFGIKSAKMIPNTDTKHTMLKLIEQADKALYRAKYNGRNRVEIYSNISV